MGEGPNGEPVELRIPRIYSSKPVQASKDYSLVEPNELIALGPY